MRREDYHSAARKLNTEKSVEKLMRIAVGDVTVNTNGHARPFLHFRLRERKVGSMTTTTTTTLGWRESIFPSLETHWRRRVGLRYSWEKFKRARPSISLLRKLQTSSRQMNKSLEKNYKCKNAQFFNHSRANHAIRLITLGYAAWIVN